MAKGWAHRVMAKSWPRSRLAELLPWEMVCKKNINAAAIGPPTA
jgi:hypothetical protein